MTKQVHFLIRQFQNHGSSGPPDFEITFIGFICSCVCFSAAFSCVCAWRFSAVSVFFRRALQALLVVKIKAAKAAPEPSARPLRPGFYRI
jgi:hypothetical protein